MHPIMFYCLWFSLLLKQLCHLPLKKCTNKNIALNISQNVAYEQSIYKLIYFILSSKCFTNYQSQYYTIWKIQYQVYIYKVLVLPPIFFWPPKIPEFFVSHRVKIVCLTTNLENYWTLNNVKIVKIHGLKAIIISPLRGKVWRMHRSIPKYQSTVYANMK